MTIANESIQYNVFKKLTNIFFHKNTKNLIFYTPRKVKDRVFVCVADARARVRPQTRVRRACVEMEK